MYDSALYWHVFPHHSFTVFPPSFPCILVHVLNCHNSKNRSIVLNTIIQHRRLMTHGISPNESKTSSNPQRRFRKVGHPLPLTSTPKGRSWLPNQSIADPVPMFFNYQKVLLKNSFASVQHYRSSRDKFPSMTFQGKKREKETAFQCRIQP